MNKITKTLSLAVAMFAIAGMTGAFGNPAYANHVDEGCSSGHWKNDADKRNEVDFDNTAFEPTDDFDATFSAISIRVKDGPGKPTIEADPTLQQALNARGGGINALAREAVAALLNESHADIHYPMSQGDIITLVNTAIAGDDAAKEAARATLFALNHNGDDDICPLPVI